MREQKCTERHQHILGQVVLEYLRIIAVAPHDSIGGENAAPRQQVRQNQGKHERGGEREPRMAARILGTEQDDENRHKREVEVLAEHGQPGIALTPGDAGREQREQRERRQRDAIAVDCRELFAEVCGRQTQHEDRREEPIVERDRDRNRKAERDRRHTRGAVRIFNGRMTQETWGPGFSC